VDSLCWSKNPQNDSYSVKLGYKSWLEENSVIHPKWWWKPLWKIKSPPRCKLTLWLALNNKLLTWDNFLRRGWCGPNRCPLCKENQETITHLFISCPYAGKVAQIIKYQAKNQGQLGPGLYRRLFQILDPRQNNILICRSSRYHDLKHLVGKKQCCF
jgi:hypothetical protein